MTLLERLRQVCGDTTRYYVNPDGPEAADEIERLREALSAIAVSYQKDMPDGIDAKTMWVGCAQIACSALQQKESE